MEQNPVRALKRGICQKGIPCTVIKHSLRICLKIRHIQLREAHQRHMKSDLVSRIEMRHPKLSITHDILPIVRVQAVRLDACLRLCDKTLLWEDDIRPGRGTRHSCNRKRGKDMYNVVVQQEIDRPYIAVL